MPPDKDDPRPLGPHIYDSEGELVWSGAGLMNENVMDFRVSNVKGEDMLTLLFKGTAFLIDDRYEIREKLEISEPWRADEHDFYFLDNGRRVLVFQKEERNATLDQSREVGFDGNCVVTYEQFQELDTETWQPVFYWDSMDHVPLIESTQENSFIEDRCAGWDYLYSVPLPYSALLLPSSLLTGDGDSHANSIDKTLDGDYLVSGRHTDTIYKVSGKDGHIIWRLGGKMSDFGQGDWTFSRQHNARIHDQNATHLVLSILDNASANDRQKPTYKSSRGLLLAVDEESMTVTILNQIDHPDGEGNYAPQRGNYQRLPDGNIFIGWSEMGIQSEHAPDGTILMHARMMAEWLGSYRSLKFNFTGRPSEKPAVHSVAYKTDDDDAESSVTVVHISWNGATEVASWNMYKTTKEGDTKELVRSIERTGFESIIEYNGFAGFILLEAVGKHGEVLGESEITATITTSNISNRMAIFLLGALSSAMVLFIFEALWHCCGPTRPRYERLAEKNHEEETKEPRTSLRAGRNSLDSVYYSES